MEGGVSGTLNIIELICGSEKVSFQRELEVLFRWCFSYLPCSGDSSITGQLNLVRPGLYNRPSFNGKMIRILLRVCTIWPKNNSKLKSVFKSISFEVLESLDKESWFW